MHETSVDVGDLYVISITRECAQTPLENRFFLTVTIRAS